MLYVSLLIDIAYTYFVVYWLVPKFLQKKRYRQFVYRLLAITLIVYLTTWNLPSLVF